jgi:hypothetical protein
MATFQISKQQFEFARDDVEQAVRDVLPEPLKEHYVVVGGRRYPPKQVLTQATGLDRADFTTHQARRVLKRLGFTAARLSQDSPSHSSAPVDGPQGGRQADALWPHRGKWVALAGPTEVLVAADTPQAVLAWLAKHERAARYGMFRVPETASESEGLSPL